MIRVIDQDRTSQEAEILATASDLVPTGFDAPISVVDWQIAMKRAIRSTAQLRASLGLPSAGPSVSDCAPSEREDAVSSFSTFVPLEYLSRIEPGNPDDPLLRQVMPLDAETDLDPRFVSDPVGDLQSMSADGLIHKYDGRALIISTGACGVHCRYCFRREFPYADVGSTSNAWQSSIEYLAKHREIDEVLLSGGDPLTLLDTKLFKLLDALESINHLRRLRIHTRMPIVIPQRVTKELVARLCESRLTAWMVIHANHPRELDSHVLDRLAMLIDGGVPVLNQSVLLSGVNDDAATLIALSRVLVDHRIQPYYLHQLDRVRGASHFEVPVEQGIEIIEEMRRSLPGYAVPTYVSEQPGHFAKTPLSSRSVSDTHSKL